MTLTTGRPQAWDTELQHFTGFRGGWFSWRNWWVEAWWRGRYVGIY